MTELPRGWEMINLREIFLHVEKVNPEKEPDREFDYIDIRSINNKTNMIERPLHYKGKDAPSRARQLIKTGDILFSTVRTYLRNIAMAREEHNNQVASTGFCILRLPNNIDNRFVFYSVLDDRFVNNLTSLQRGSS